MTVKFSTMHSIVLQAEDVWLFRDGKPFSAGLQHLATSMFPPLPTVMQGAIRSNQLVLEGVDLTNKQEIKETVGTTWNLDQLSLRGPFVVCKESGKWVRYFPQPADAYSPDSTAPEDIQPCAAPVELSDSNGQKGNNPEGVRLLGLTDEPQKSASGLWLAEDDLRAYLGGKSVTGRKSSEIFVSDFRTHNGLDSSRKSTQEGMLFSINYTKTQQQVGIQVGIQGEAFEWQQGGTLRIGGEGRAATYEPVDMEKLNPDLMILHGTFKVYFATPAYFKDGWYPENYDWSQFFTGEVKLIAAAIGRYLSVGGFDHSNNSHKPSVRYIPAGSVYYFETVTDMVEFKDIPVTENHPDHGDYETKSGFGQVIISQI